MNKFEKEMYKDTIYMERHKLHTELYKLKYLILKELGVWKIMKLLNNFAEKLGF